MTARRQAFVVHYLATLNAADAARKAGYSARTANRIGHELLTKPAIQRAVQAGKAAQLHSVDLSATRTLEEVRRIAFADPAGCFDALGNLLPIADMAPETRTAIASVTVVKRNVTSGESRADEVHEVRLWDKVRALESLAKHFGLLVEKVEHTGSVELVARLQAARLRGKTTQASQPCR
jgi:phage terminase small subunit